MRYKRAMFYRKMDNNKVGCYLCPHECNLSNQQKGICSTRQNIDGELYSINYGKVSSIALDPIEKKPFRHFYPGSNILSIGSYGCNMKCSFCQNWHIAHDSPNILDVTPEFIIQKAIEAKNSNCIGIAYTYNEPTVWYDFVYDTSRRAKADGLVNALVTNGFIQQQPIKELLPFIDAMNIDVKAFTTNFYRNICKAKLEDVKKTVDIANEECHVEITTLLIPGLNDSLEEIGQLASWLASINPEIPLHISRFFPNYKMQDIKPTPIETLKKVKNEALKHLKYVYIGNI